MTERANFFIKGKAHLAEAYHYTASGLDNVYLLNGVEIEKTSYGPMVNIENLNGLHHAIGLWIVEKDEPMSGPEFRFLRKAMELTQRELASMMNVSDQTVANYEKGKTEEVGPAGPLMRLTYLLYVLPDETRTQVLKKLTAKGGNRLPDVPRRKIVERWQETHKKAA